MKNASEATTDYKNSTSSGKVAGGSDVAKGLADVPGRVQSRINVSNKDWAHTLERHFNPAKSNKSQFTISQDELKSLLSDKSIIQSPARQLETGNFSRTITLDRQVGNLAEKWGGGSTNTFSIVTDSAGNLLTATPGNL